MANNYLSNKAYFMAIITIYLCFILFQSWNL